MPTKDAKQLHSCLIRTILEQIKDLKIIIMKTKYKMMKIKVDTPFH